MYQAPTPGVLNAGKQNGSTAILGQASNQQMHAQSQQVSVLPMFNAHQMQTHGGMVRVSLPIQNVQGMPGSMAGNVQQLQQVQVN